MPDGFDIMGWLAAGSDGKNPHTPENVDPVIVDGINYLKELGCTRIGGVGYCFGAKVSHSPRELAVQFTDRISDSSLSVTLPV